MSDTSKEAIHRVCMDLRRDDKLYQRSQAADLIEAITFQRDAATERAEKAEGCYRQARDLLASTRDELYTSRARVNALDKAIVEAQTFIKSLRTDFMKVGHFSSETQIIAGIDTGLRGLFAILASCNQAKQHDDMRDERDTFDVLANQLRALTVLFPGIGLASVNRMCRLVYTHAGTFRITVERLDRAAQAEREG